jgi:bacillithiol system protein YtxJ
MHMTTSRQNHPEPSRYLEISSASDVLAVLAAEGPQVLFLRDPYCPISADADVEVAALGYGVAVVDVSAHSDLGALIAHETGIRHESPQVLVIKDGRPAWHASHYGITRETVSRAVAQASEKHSA